jgi:hypothetical protein
MNEDFIGPLTLKDSIDLKHKAIEKNKEILLKYGQSRWYNQSLQYGELLKKELQILESYQK